MIGDKSALLRDICGKKGGEPRYLLVTLRFKCVDPTAVSGQEPRISHIPQGLRELTVWDRLQVSGGRGFLHCHWDRGFLFLFSLYFDCTAVLVTAGFYFPSSRDHHRGRTNSHRRRGKTLDAVLHGHSQTSDKVTDYLFKM